ncbi:MAG: hypothetical protein LBC51_10145 [Treponema sp.]|jgi:hypothetical protein|nr:hypothetical protein [Treponema sp.]
MRKKVWALWRVLPVVFLASCGLEIPESLTITGKPGVYLPLGSPFGASGQSINDYIGRDKIQEMINPSDNSGTGSGNKAAVLYDYLGNGTAEPEVQTYLVRYEIAKLNLDLQQHIEEADDITVPALVIPSLPGGSGTFPVYLTQSGTSLSEPSQPLFEISLGAIAEWMENVQLEGAGITVQGGASLQAALELSIPQLGIDKYTTGEAKGEHLVFTGDTPYTLLDPNNSDSETIKIYARLLAPPEGGTYAMELNFNWTGAILYPGEDGVFTGKYTLNFGEMQDYLGNAVLKSMPARVFISGLPVGADGKLSLSIGTESLADKESIISKTLENLSFDDEDSTVSGKIPEHSIIDPPKIELVDYTGKTTLDYAIAVNSTPITPTTAEALLVAELLIEIPLEFTVTGDTLSVEDAEGLKQTYRALDLKPLRGLSDLGSDADVFGRTGEEDDLLAGLEEVKLTFYNYHNTLIGGLNLFVGKDEGSGPLEGELVLLSQGIDASPPSPIGFTDEDVAYPFNPRFKVLVEDGHTLKIGRLAGGNELDFSLALEASADIDQTIDF